MPYKSILRTNGISKYKIKKNLQWLQWSYPYDEMLQDLESSVYMNSTNS